ncbi:MAG: hypothetical protein WDM78_05035 [Puia sp.]
MLGPEEVFAISTIASRENCIGGLFSKGRLIVDPREAMVALPGVF